MQESSDELEIIHAQSNDQGGDCEIDNAAATPSSNSKENSVFSSFFTSTPSHKRSASVLSDETVCSNTFM